MDVQTIDAIISELEAVKNLVKLMENATNEKVKSDKSKIAEIEQAIKDHEAIKDFATARGLTLALAIINS
jgi:DNA-binding protein H-NS